MELTPLYNIISLNRAVIILLLSLPVFMNGQITQSPYSRYGVGEISNPVTARYFSMGGIGVGASNWTDLNRLNPASYADLRATTLNFSFYSELNSMNTGDFVSNRFNGGFHSFSFAFKTNKAFTIAAGLSPFSGIGYDIQVQDTTLFDTVPEPFLGEYEGTGGLNQFYIGAGVRMFKKLRIGANLPIVFGNMQYNWRTDYENNNIVTVDMQERSSVVGLIPSFGVQFADSLKFKRTVNLLDEYNSELNGISRQREDLAQEEIKLQKSEKELEKYKDESSDKIREYKEKRENIRMEIEILEDQGKGKSPEAEKLQKKEFRFVRKIKKIEQKIRKKEKDLRQEQREISRQKKKLNEKEKRIRNELANIKKSDSDSLKFKTEKDWILLRLGSTLSLPSALKGESIRTIDNQHLTDTLSLMSDGVIQVPAKIGFGISIRKPGAWTAGLDVVAQDWSDYMAFGFDPGLQNSIKINLGGEWIPEYFGDKLHERIAWRAGAFYHSTGVQIEGSTIEERGLTIGAGIPLGRRPDRRTGLFSRINFGLSAGQRGTLDNGLLKENFVRFRLGLNLNDSQWFLKRKVN